MITQSAPLNAFLYRGPVMRMPCTMAVNKNEKHGFESKMRRGNFDPRVYLVTDRRTTTGWTVEQIVEAAIRGNGKQKGVTFVQLRDKQVEWASSVKLGHQLRELTLATGTAFVVNDNIQLAQEIEADGVHVGQDDSSVAEARDALGINAIVGVSAGTMEEAEQAISDGADYIGVGSVFATGTKSDAGEPIGPNGLAHVVTAVNGRIPIVAIGGIAPSNVRSCWRAGANGVAVISAIMKSKTPGIVASDLNQSFDFAHKMPIDYKE